MKSIRVLWLDKIGSLAISGESAVHAKEDDPYSLGRGNVA